MYAPINLKTLTCDLQICCSSLWSSNTIGNLTDIGSSIISLDRIDDEVPLCFNVDPVGHAGHGHDGGVVPVPRDREISRGTLPLTHKTDYIPFCFVLI